MITYRRCSKFLAQEHSIRAKDFSWRGIFLSTFIEFYFVLLQADVKFKHPGWKSVGILLNIPGMSTRFVLTEEDMVLD